jgi:FOG: HEAT repeat
MDTSFLHLWFTSLFLAAISLCWMAGLIIARVLRTRRDAARDADRVIVRDGCLAVMAQGVEAAPKLLAMKHRPRLIAEVLMDFVSLVRGTEFSDLITVCRQTGIDVTLRNRLFKGSRAGRLAATEALALFPGPETEAALNRVLDRSRDSEVCLAALRTLAELGKAPPLQFLIWAFSNTPVASTDHVLITRKAIEQQPDMALELLQRKDQRARALILLADGLGSVGDYRAIGPIGTLYENEDPAVRTEAVRALGLLGHPASVPVVLRALADAQWEVRVAASEAAERIGGGELVSPLAELLADPVWWVRFKAGEALGRMGPAGEAALQQIVNTVDDVTRNVAVLALKEKPSIRHQPVGVPA